MGGGYSAKPVFYASHPIALKSTCSLIFVTLLHFRPTARDHGAHNKFALIDRTGCLHYKLQMRIFSSFLAILAGCFLSMILPVIPARHDPPGAARREEKASITQLAG